MLYVRLLKTTVPHQCRTSAAPDQSGAGHTCVAVERTYRACGRARAGVTRPLAARGLVPRADRGRPSTRDPVPDVVCAMPGRVRGVG
jgi:hypothetical protein